MATLPQSGMTPDALIQIDLTPRRPSPKPAWLKARADKLIHETKAQD